MLENGAVLEMDRHLKSLEEGPICPECRQSCESIYTDPNGEAIGCEACYLDYFTKIDAVDWQKRQKEQQ